MSSNPNRSRNGQTGSVLDSNVSTRHAMAAINVGIRDRETFRDILHDYSLELISQSYSQSQPSAQPIEEQNYHSRHCFCVPTISWNESNFCEGQLDVHLESFPDF
jgi:hypothetical protein